MNRSKNSTPFFMVLSIIMPIAGCIGEVIEAFKKNKCGFLSVIFFLSLINTTIKGEETDYSWYLPLFSNAGKFSFIDYLSQLNSAKEPVYMVINYIVYYLFCGSRFMFSLFSTFFFYVFAISGFRKWQKYLQIENKYVVVGICVFLFFPYIFANSANLLRQYYANAICLWAIPEILNGNKKYWIALFGAVFTHTSSGLILLLLAFPFLKNPFSFKTAILYGFVFILLKLLPIIAEFLLPFIGGSTIEYILIKASTETTYETEYTAAKAMFAIVTTILPFIIVQFSKRYRHNSAIIHFLNMQMFILVFVLSNLDQAELCERMNIYLWCMLPYNIMVVLPLFKLNKNICILMAYAMFAFFVIYQTALTKYTYYCHSRFLYQNSIAFYLDNRLDQIK